mgnify:CR=1 FL=1
MICYINISSMLNLTFKFIIFVFFLSIVQADIVAELQDDNALTTSETVSEDMTHMTYFIKELEVLTGTLQKKDFITSLDVLDKIRERIQFQQHQIMSSFFPKSYDEWILKKQVDVVENELADTDYGVIFTRSYSNKKGHSIEINIVNAEELIRDYNDLFTNPSLVKGMGNTHIVDQKGYKAIETIFDDVKHYEQNIVLSNTVIMTFIAIGIDGVDILNEFIKIVDIKAIDSYLN